MRRVHPRLAGLVRLAPAAILHLPVYEEPARAAHALRVCVVLTHRLEGLEREHGRVGEADAPRAVPAAVLPLRGADVVDGAVAEGGDLGGAVGRVVLLEHLQRGDGGGRALDVVVLDHDAAEDFGGVEVLQKGGAAGGFVGCAAAGGVLHGQ